MFRSLLAAGLAGLLSCPAFCEPQPCGRATCPALFHLSSSADSRTYALLLAAPEAGCPRVRYRVETASQVFLGHTPPLAPGEVAVVRLGAGFAEGVHVLHIAALGCATGPVLARRVTLRKASPDHGWRAAALLAGKV